MNLSALQLARKQRRNGQKVSTPLQMRKPFWKGRAFHRYALGNFGRVYRFAALLFFISLCLLPCLAAQELPDPVGYINDFAGVMKEEDIEAAQNIAASIKRKTGVELAIATVQSMAPYGSIEEYSIALAEKWGIGEKGKDNGVLLILAVDERKVRIEVGYGLEGTIPDSMAGRILDTAIIPAFREDDFSGGLLQGYRTIAACIENGEEFAEAAPPKANKNYISPVGIFILFFRGFLAIFISIFVLLIYKLVRKPGGGGGGSWHSTGSFGSSFDSGFSSSSSSDSFSGGSFGGGGASRDF